MIPISRSKVKKRRSRALRERQNPLSASSPVPALRALGFAPDNSRACNLRLHASEEKEKRPSEDGRFFGSPGRKHLWFFGA
jgi:hypothetical protein